LVDAPNVPQATADDVVRPVLVYAGVKTGGAERERHAVIFPHG
jgi:hypothetical protein